MTRFLPVIFLMLIASRACGSTVNLSWSYDYTGLPVCSATVTKNCMDHFEMQDATGEHLYSSRQCKIPPTPAGR